MSILTSGRKDPCKDTRGGIKEIWLSHHNSYDPQVIVGAKAQLITSYPTTLLYRFYGKGQMLTETRAEDGHFDQVLSMTLTKQDIPTLNILNSIIQKKVIAVCIDWQGKAKVVGIYNGLNVDISSTSGGGKAELNGYQLKLSGSEERPAPFLPSFPGSGFVTSGVTYGALLSSSSEPTSLSAIVSSIIIPS